MSRSPALAYRDVLPFSWRPAAADEPLARWADQNQRMLAAVAALGERTLVDADAPGAAEFERLHRKVDLVIELLGALLHQGRTDVSPTALCLSSEGLSWPAAAGAPTPGSRVSVSIELHPCAPTAWQWTGEVSAAPDGEVMLHFAVMPEPLVGEIERYIFLQHRRSVADARSPGQRGTRGSAP
ncbi:PilZ domain-containing protein [Solimonas marina]|uniref:PilZ domain-containing protein n=1 Tax=Solimonas marina TaxID=2714601 RepID=UPI00344B6FF5